MENNQPKKKNAGLTALIALLLTITTIASCVGMYAWARYISSQGGNATAQIAKWHFELKNGQMVMTEGEDAKQLLELTRTDDYGHVAQGKIAPGTHGELPIVIDTTNTEVDLEYSLVVVIENCPTNMTFTTSDATKTTEVRTQETVGGQTVKIATITVTKYIPNDTTNANRLHNETITWNWPYETLDANNSATAGDEVDKADNGKEITVRVTATGTEMLSNPNASAKDTPGTVAYQATHASTSGIARGQAVDYTPDTASISNDTLTLAGASIIGDTKVASIAGASLSGTINSSEASNWEILDFDETTGEVKIIPRTYSSKILQLSGMDGYNNAIQALNKVASIYKNETYAESARSLTVEDVNEVENYTPYGEIVQNSWDNRYGMDSNLNIVDAGTKFVASGDEEVEVDNSVARTYTSTAETGIYYYRTGGFSNWHCWLASRCVNLSSDGCNFYVRSLRSGDVRIRNLFFVDATGGGSPNVNDYNYPVVPVVTLKSDVHMTKNGNTWTLSQN